MSTPTIERLAQSAFEEIDLDDLAPPFSELADGEVTSMTTELFAMVVADNALGFLDYEGDAEPDPFTCLRSAIVAAVEVRLTELVSEVREARAEDEEAEAVDIVEPSITGAVDPDDLVVKWHTWFSSEPVDARLIAQRYEAHIDDTLAVLNRDDRFVSAANVSWHSYSTWALSGQGESEAASAELNEAWDAALGDTNPDPFPVVRQPDTEQTDLDAIADGLAEGNAPDPATAATYLKDADL